MGALGLLQVRWYGQRSRGHDAQWSAKRSTYYRASLQALSEVGMGYWRRIEVLAAARLPSPALSGRKTVSLIRESDVDAEKHHGSPDTTVAWTCVVCPGR